LGGEIVLTSDKTDPARSSVQGGKFSGQPSTPLVGLPESAIRFPMSGIGSTRETRREAIDGGLGRLARPKTMLLTAAEHTFHCGRPPGVVPMALVIGGADRLGQVLYLLVDHIGMDPV
jgi:hypothetical protein